MGDELTKFSYQRFARDNHLLKDNQLEPFITLLAKKISHNDIDSPYHLDSLGLGIHLTLAG